MKKKKQKRIMLSKFTFSNGNYFAVEYVPKPPKIARQAHDYLYVSIVPEKGRGEPHGWYMNGYDVNALIWALCRGVLEIQTQKLPHR